MGFKCSQKRKVYRRAINKFVKEVNKNLQDGWNGKYKVKLMRLDRNKEGTEYYALLSTLKNEVIQDITKVNVNIVTTLGHRFFQHLNHVICDCEMEESRE